jgi:hypothetical protein
MNSLNIIYEKTKTQIGTVTVDAAVFIKHSISSSMTKNPVEEGAQVTDHVELNPQAISIQGVISDTPLDFNVLNDIVKGNFKNLGKSFSDGVKSSLNKSSRSVEQYQALMELWKSRKPFQVITGLKVYDSMILTKLDVDQTSTTGQAIHFNADIEEIRIISSKAVGKENFKEAVKDIASKKKNLGSKVADKLDPVKDQKKVKGASSLYDGIKSGKLS